ncbi:MAG: alanyl-tRNA editing protein [Pseudomonadota bacterium]
MTERLYLEDAYLTRAEASVTAHTPEGGIIVDRSVFYPTGGGQPGDSGRIEWTDGAGRAAQMQIATAIKPDAFAIALIPAEPRTLPPVGARISQVIDADRRLGHMRVHTALHLLSVVLPLPVTGGAVGADKGRLDFDMAEPPEDKTALEGDLNALIWRDLPVRADWITDAELQAKPALVKTMSVAPPMGEGRVRLIRIGEDDRDPVDLQPCGGTHVNTTGEIGAIRIGKIEKKGRQNRRVYIHLSAQDR